jgi:TetR/AcrR family transcriptional regulator, regulator of cefoperazone and chloramphenicol sensitivity
MPPTTWFAQLTQIESYAPMMGYLVHSMLSGGELGRALMAQMINNAERYIEDAVRAGTIKPNRGPKARARLLAMSGGGGFLLYLHIHDNPTDIEAVTGTRSGRYQVQRYRGCAVIERRRRVRTREFRCQLRR